MKTSRHSKKREQVLEIFRNGDLLTANDVYERLPQIDRATIYRNLSFFVEQNLLRKVNVIEGVTSYEINNPNDYHQHFICDNCNDVIPIEINPQEILSKAPTGVVVENFEVNLKGKCRKCK